MNPTIALLIAQDHIAELRRDRQRAQLLTDRRRRKRPAFRVARLWPPARRVANANLKEAHMHPTIALMIAQDHIAELGPQRSAAPVLQQPTPVHGGPCGRRRI